MAMFKDELSFIYESIIVETYNADFYNKQIKRFAPQAGRYVTPDQIRSRIRHFSFLKNNPKTAKEVEQKVRKAIEQGRLPANQREGVVIAAKDTSDEKRIRDLERMPLEIRNYNWKDLESIVDQYPDPSEKLVATQQIETQSTTGDLIYDENNLRVIIGRNATECFIIKRQVQRERGLAEDDTLYPWCISRNPFAGSNLFTTYRFGDPKKTAYFVIDNDKPVEDKWHFCVIHVAEYPHRSTQFPGEYIYMVTSAKNDGDVYMPWEEVVKRLPKLQGLESLFVFIPLSEEEQIQQVLLRGAGARDFAKYTSYKIKTAYIRMSPNNKIYKQDYLKLDPNLQHLYINVRAPAAEDFNQLEKVQRLLLLFADSDPRTELADIFKKCKLANDRSKKETGKPDSNWPIIASNNPTVLNSKQKQTFKRYMELVKMEFHKLNEQIKAEKKRKEEEERKRREQEAE